MRYQEKCATRGDIRALYEKVIANPFISQYRGYTESTSYGWDPDSDDYMKVSGEFWFENPEYDPDVEVSPSKLGKMVGEGAIRVFEDGLRNGISSRGIRSQIPEIIDEPCDISTGPRILDSGNRRQFESGAVRDICEGKGRCDLLPLDVVAYNYDHFDCAEELSVFHAISRFQETGDSHHLYHALNGCNIFSSVADMFLEVAKHFEEGCKKYGENNWQKGIPTHCYVDSAVRHYLKYLRGDKDEPHDRAFCWNILCCIWTCIHKPELNDYAPKEDKKDD